MGRRTWLTLEQFLFLKSFVPTLDDEKKHNGLIPCYDRISVEFIKKWVSPFTESAQDRVAADAVRTQVSSLVPSVIQPLMLLRQQIHNWFKNIRKTGNPSPPTATVDLTGKTPRKPPLYNHTKHTPFNITEPMTHRCVQRSKTCGSVAKNRESSTHSPHS
jgi:hypothetical protein